MSFMFPLGLLGLIGVPVIIIIYIIQSKYTEQIGSVVNDLQKDGYEIEAVQNRGYRIVGAPDILSENELSSIRKTDWIGKKIYY